MWDFIVEMANTYWNLWLMLMFLVAIGYALWPTKKHQREMDHAARIPFEEEAPVGETPAAARKM